MFGKSSLSTVSMKQSSVMNLRKRGVGVACDVFEEGGMQVSARSFGKTVAAVLV